jgi:DNA-binding CsgD family transcriptional regulator
MTSGIALDRTIDAIYAAALEPSKWTEALREMSECLGSAAACVFVIDASNGHVPFWVGRGLEIGEKDYREHYVTVDPRRRYAMAHPHTRLHYDYMLIDERGMDRDEFYDWQCRTTDQLRYFLGCRIEVADDHSGFAAFHWPRRHGHVQKSDIRLFKRIVPHLERAVKISARLGSLQQRNAATRTVLDSLGHGVALLDRAGRVVLLNRAAEAMLTAGDGIALTATGLIASRAEDDSALRQSIAGAATAPAIGGSLAIARASGCTPYAVSVSPLPPNEFAPFASCAAAVAVLITDPEQRHELPEALLMRLYGLTRAEAAVAVRIGAGMALKRVAGELGIAASTARLHLQRVMNKTGAHRQGDLVRLLLSATSTTVMKVP